MLSTGRQGVETAGGVEPAKEDDPDLTGGPTVEWQGHALSLQDAYDLAADFEASGHLPTAKRLFKAITAEAPRHGEAWYRLGLLFQYEGEHQIAVDCFEAALSVWPDHPPYLKAAAQSKTALANHRMDR